MVGKPSLCGIAFGKLVTRQLKNALADFLWCGLPCETRWQCGAVGA
jgi:hypothetical protein